MARDLATRRHAPPTHQRVVATADGKSRAWRRVRYWLSLGSLSACRSGNNEPNGGVTDRNGAVAEKVHKRVFPPLKRSDGGGGILDFLGRRL